MVNTGPNTNASSFSISFNALPDLDGKNTVFGRVIHGFEICKMAEAVPQNSKDTPSLPIVIVEAGELSQNEKLQAEDCDWLHTYQK